AVKETIDKFSKSMPDGYLISTIYDQGHESAVANQGFVTNLVVSVITVVAILLFFIGFKNGLLVGSGLVFSIFATLIVMMSSGIALQRMSLAAIIIAMGMLVDNAIVVSDSALVNMQRGMRKRPAILRACKSTALPLLAATVIAILTFLPIYYSPHITGELLSSLVIVIGVSLMFSWVFALTQTPFFIQEYVRRPRPDELKSELFGGKYYNMFRRSLRWVLAHRALSIGTLVVALLLSAWSFRFIPKVFVPALEKQYFTIDMWMPEGTNIHETDRISGAIADYVRIHDGVETVAVFNGRTPPRYYLSNIVFGPQSNYAQLLIKCHSPKDAVKMHALLQDSIRRLFPEPLIKVNKFELSPLTEAMIEARFLGPDAAVLDSLVGVATDIMRRNPKAADVRNEWGNMTCVMRPVYDPMKAGSVGISKAQMMQSVKSISDGIPVAVFRDNERQVPVLLKTADTDITDTRALDNFPVWNGESSAPLSQVTDGVETAWEWPQIRTYNRQLSMAAMCGVQPGHTMAEVHGEIRKEVEAMKLPDGYKFFWDSQYKDQTEGLQALSKFFPLAFLALVVILVALFGNFREPAIIVAVLPLSLIGVAVGMLVTGFDFGFFPIAGWLGLLGMIIKNVIVLLDEINVQRRNGIEPYTAIVEATVSRTRPVLMAATTTILGMVPLLFDVAFGGMAATIIFGLSFATLLTLFITPALYSFGVVKLGIRN
ncbi:MAG: efflux RND transporter permease subunit, partial [Prevotella sp.]